MLRNMVGMIDRANTMKAFDRQLDSLRTEVANPEIQLEFLYCTARFLLGLTTAAEKALTEVAKERGLEGKRTGRKEDWKESWGEKPCLHSKASQNQNLQHAGTCDFLNY